MDATARVSLSTRSDPESHPDVFQQSLVELLETKDAKTVLLSFLSARSLLRMSRVCRQTRTAVSAYMKEAFDIERLLKRFFDQPSAFRTLQARTGTLIAGSIALQYFDRSNYPSSDLDLYVHPRHRREVGMWLLSAGYAFYPYRDRDSDFETVISRNPQSEGLHYGVPGVAEVMTFRRALSTLR